jgi:proline iminopeptidase
MTPRLEPPGRYVSVGDTRLHVDERGSSDAPVLLYVHGGPGQGCVDFMAYQGDRLAKDLHVIGVDQRGALFSDPLLEGTALTEDELVDDFEALRVRLGVEDWSVLGHSYGGRLALRYATRHPTAVASVIFDCPPWDHALATANLLEKALPLLQELGQTDAVRRARVMIDTPPTPSHATYRERGDILDALGPRRSEVYLARTDLGPDPFPSVSLPEEVQRRSARHTQAIAPTDGFSESLLPLLRQVEQPALLIKGVGDPVTSPTEVERFQTDVRHGRVEILDGSGHFAQLEEPERYANLVRSFVHASGRRG